MWLYYRPMWSTIDSCLLLLLLLVVVDLYSASRSASNALNVPLRRKKMSFQRRFEAVSTPSKVPEWMWKRVPFHRTRDGESPTTKRAATVSWNHQPSIYLLCWTSVWRRCQQPAPQPGLVMQSCAYRVPTGHCIDRTAGLRGVRAADVESPSGRVSRISGNLHQHNTSAGLPNSAQNRQSATFNASDGQKQRAPVTKGKAHFGTTHNYGQVHTKCQTPSNGQTDEWTRGSLRFSRLYVVSFRGVHPIGVIELNRNLRGGGGVKSANSAEKNTRNLVSWLAGKSLKIWPTDVTF